MELKKPTKFTAKRLARKIFLPMIIVQLVAVVASTFITFAYTLNLVKQPLNEKISSYSGSTAEKLNSDFEKRTNTTVLHARMIDAKSGAANLDQAGDMAR